MLQMLLSFAMLHHILSYQQYQYHHHNSNMLEQELCWQKNHTEHRQYHQIQQYH